MQNPTSYDKLVAAVKERASYGESRFSEIWSSLQVFSVKELGGKQGTWHRKCYQDATHSGGQKKDMREYCLDQMSQDERPEICKKQNLSANSLGQRQPLTTKQCVSSVMVKVVMNAGASLCEAIELSRNDKLRVKFSTAINASDAHAIDIKYHKNCRTKNVSNVLHEPLASRSSSSVLAGEIAAKIEFLTTMEIMLRNGNVLHMSELDTAFNSIAMKKTV